MAQPIVAEVTTPAFATLPLPADFCPSPPETDAPGISWETPSTEDLTPSLAEGLLEPETVDLTRWLIGQLALPEVISIPVSLTKPPPAGKSYDSRDPSAQQLPLFEDAEADSRCIHGLKKRFCDLCAERERRQREKSHEKPPTTINLFDLIRPILQPPLGANLDNPLAFPPGEQLFPFQREGVKWLGENDAALLGDEMGLGKSIQAITALRLLLRSGRVATALILSPKSVLTDWERKLLGWAPEVIVITVRGTTEKREVLWQTPAHVYLTTYETLRQDLAGSLASDAEPLLEFDFGGNSRADSDIARRTFDLIILDEIQRIKNPGAAVTKAVRLVKGRMRWGLSGTPLENRVEDLISIFAYLKPGLLHYEHAQWPQKVKSLIRPYFLRRRKAEALVKLPAKVLENVWLDLTPTQRQAYEREEMAGVSDLRARSGAVTVQHVLALITRLKQICNTDPVTQESCKLDYLLERLEAVAEEDGKALVFSQYPNKTLPIVKTRLAAHRPLLYTGSLSEAERDRVVAAFQSNDDNRVLLMSVKAGGQGLTLTRANYVYHFDLWWNPAVAAQAEDRAHRIGQEKRVSVTYLYAVDTVEERIYRLLQRKRQLFKEVIDDLSDEKLERALTEEELFGLFGLQPPRRPGQQTAGSPKAGTDRLRDISPQQFEKLIARLYQRMGYRVRVTPASRDQGVDVYAWRQTDTGFEQLAIQCKHYQGRVGVEHARSLYGVIQADPRITKGVLVTTGDFSDDCRRFADGKRLEMVDGTYLKGLLEKYRVEL